MGDHPRSTPPDRSPRESSGSMSRTARQLLRPLERARKGAQPRRINMHGLRTITTGLRMGESPRWHDGRVWLSDMGANEVVAVDATGASEVVAVVPGMPMGLGWLPDGRMLIVSSQDGRLLRREPDGSTATHADLSGLSTFPWSDMAVDGRGNAYI